ncbi:hypothetical protein KC357_g281 [Hortaea werneckii]|nr:hypothetical protein KC357_g281 [Hortaea werneckii]
MQRLPSAIALYPRPSIGLLRRSSLASPATASNHLQRLATALVLLQVLFVRRVDRFAFVSLRQESLLNDLFDLVRQRLRKLLQSESKTTTLLMHLGVIRLKGFRGKMALQGRQVFSCCCRQYIVFEKPGTCLLTSAKEHLETSDLAVDVLRDFERLGAFRILIFLLLLAILRLGRLCLLRRLGLLLLLGLFCFSLCFLGGLLLVDGTFTVCAIELPTTFANLWTVVKEAVYPDR